MEIGKTRIDPTAVREGVWTEFLVVGPDREPVTIKLKMALADAQVNPAYRAALRKALEPHERLLALYKEGERHPARPGEQDQRPGQARVRGADRRGLGGADEERPAPAVLPGRLPRVVRGVPRTPCTGRGRGVEVRAIPRRGPGGSGGKLTACLIYALTRGEHERKVADQCYATNRPLPTWLRDAPRLEPNLVGYYAAFCELTTCRPGGFGPAPIPWTAIMDWCDREGLHGSDRADFLYLIRAMDRAYLEHAENELKKNRPAKPDKPVKGGRIGAQ